MCQSLPDQSNLLAISDDQKEFRLEIFLRSSSGVAEDLHGSEELRTEKTEHLQDHRLRAGDACCSFSAPGVMTGHDRTRRRVPSQRCVRPYT